jgi:MFS family permease
MAQGGLIPCLTRACVDWVPESRRGSASAALNAGMSAGAVAAGGLSAVMLPWLGWRLTLALFALAGTMWAVGFWIIFCDRPEQHPWVNPAECDLIHNGYAQTDPVIVESRAEPSAAVLPASETGATPGTHPIVVYASRGFLLLNSQAFCRAYGYAFLTSWLPSYLERAHGLPVARASALTMVPLAGYIVGSILGGPLIDGLLRHTGNKRLSRSMVGAVALMVTGVGFSAALLTTYPNALATLALGISISGFAGPATWAATMDVGGKSSTSFMAILNMSGNLGAYLCPSVTGMILDAFPERWDLVLLMLAAVYITGGICRLPIDPDSRRATRQASPPHQSFDR